MENKKYYIVYQITNKINNKIYIGVHITENINDKYMGSGTNIKKAIKEFGKENFEKIILFNCNSKEEMLEKERELVNEEFIKNNNTYNIVLGGGKINTDNMVVVKDKNDIIQLVHKTDPRYLSGELISHMSGLVSVKDKNNNSFQISINDKRYLSGELTHNRTKQVPVKDRNNNTLSVSINDDNYLSGEYIHVAKGLITVKDKNGNTLNVSVTDPRYIFGELIPIWVGKRHKKETKEKMSIAKKGKYIGENSSQFNTCWIYNLIINESKKIKKEELDKWISDGWKKGRKIKF